MSATLLVGLFVVGYLCIVLEHWLDVNKAAFALLTAAVCWATLLLSGGDHHEVLEALGEHLADIAQVVLFLLGAMTIVELLTSYRAFDPLQRRLAQGGHRAILWGLPVCTFFLSAALDNVTTTILMISLLRPLIPEGTTRLKMIGILVIAANAGGAWSPIGDVTTTMLWIDDRVTSGQLVLQVLPASLVSVAVPLLWSARSIGRNLSHKTPLPPATPPIPRTGLVLAIGVGALLAVPILKTTVGMPPYLGILFGLGLVWVVTDRLDAGHELRVPHMLTRVDVSSVLFFLGILLAVAALEANGLLTAMAESLEPAVGSKTAILTVLGMLSAIVDNVPLTAAVMGMWDTTQYAPDADLWHLTAFCVGTGGSILVIGSAAGVIAMGMERISFGWYLRHIGPMALAGYLAGVATYVATHGWT